MMLSFVVALFYLCYGKFRFTFDKTTTIFGGLYAVCYCVCTVALLKALKIGYVSLTSLIFSYSLILPALFGIFAYSTSPSVAFYFGLALFAVSLFFLGKKKTSEEKKSFSVKWLIYVLAAFFANGGCSILQTHQQRLCNGNYKSEFMLTAMIIVFVFCLIITLVGVKKNKDEIATNVTKGWYAAIGYITGKADGKVIVKAVATNDFGTFSSNEIEITVGKGEAPKKKKGCGSSVESGIFAILGLAGLAAIMIKKRKGE